MASPSGKDGFPHKANTALSFHKNDILPLEHEKLKYLGNILQPKEEHFDGKHQLPSRRNDPDISEFDPYSPGARPRSANSHGNGSTYHEAAPAANTFTCPNGKTVPMDSQGGYLSQIVKDNFSDRAIPNVVTQPICHPPQLQDSTTGELGFVSCQGIKRSQRVKSYTERGFEYTLDLHVNQFKKAVTNHRRCVVICQNTIDSGHFEVSELVKFRDKLEKCVVSVSDAFHDLTELSPSKYDEFIEELTACESANRMTLHIVTEALRSLETKSLPRSTVSHKGGRQSNSHHSASHKSCSCKSSSHRTKSSSGSSKQTKSVTSMKAEAIAKAATLRTKLKYFDAENEHKTQLNKLKAMRNLEIEEAKFIGLTSSDAQIPPNVPLPSSQLFYNTMNNPVCRVVSKQADNFTSIAQTRQQNISLIDIGQTDTQTPNKNHSVLNVADVVSSNLQDQTTQLQAACPVLTACGHSFPDMSQLSAHRRHSISAFSASNQSAQRVTVFNTPGIKNQTHNESAGVINAHCYPVATVSVQQSTVDANGTCNRHANAPFSYLEHSKANSMPANLNSDLNCNAATFSPQSEQLMSIHDQSLHLPTSNHIHQPANYSPSGVIAGGPEPPQINDLVRTFNQLFSLNRLKPPDPGVFSGDPLQYPSWRNSFRTLIERKDIDPAEKLSYLKDCLAGEAKHCVENFLIMPTDDAYYEAIDLIDKRFGNSFVIAQAFKQKIESWQRISGKDYIGLREFSDFLRQCEVAYRTNSSLKVLDDDLQNRVMLSKLPDWIVSRWARVVHAARGQSGYPKFPEFVKFLVGESDIVCDPVVSLHAVAERKIPQKGQNSETLKLAVSGRSYNTVNDECSNCLYCNKDNHQLEKCFKLKGKSYEEKKAFITDKGLCFGCLKGGHFAKDCKKRLKCADCQKNHPTVMHGEIQKDSQGNTKTNKKNGTGDGSPNANESETKHVSFMTHNHKIKRSTMVVPVYVSHQSNPQHEILTYALLDSQSDTSFISEDTLNHLDVDGTSVTLKLSTMTAECHTMESKRLSGLRIRGFDSNIEIPLSVAYSHNNIPANRDCIPTAQLARHWPYLESMVKNLMPKADCSVGLLIGYNCPKALMPREVIPAVGNGPYAQRTDLGWGVVGPISKDDGMEDYSCFHTCSDVTGSFITLRTSTKEIISPRDVIHFFKREEDYRNGKDFSVEDTRFMALMDSSTRKTEDGHYEMPLPWRNVHNLPENNKPVAMKRLRSLIKRFKSQPEHYNLYVKFMQDLIDKGYAERVPQSELQDDIAAHYLPHHGVYNPSKPGKLRVVMDASAKYKGKSLNDFLMSGPDLMNKLIGVLCRFRKEEIAFMCDVQSMFYQFKVCEKDRNFLRFLWFENHNFNNDIIVMRSTVHLFGVICSPAIANFGLKRAAINGEDSFGPAVVNFIHRNFYVDDGLTSVSSEADAIELIKQSLSLCRSSGLHLHKFVCNSKAVLETIPPQVRAEDLKEFDFTHDYLPIQRALGVSWCIESDAFQFRVTVKDHPLTRRGILSTVCSIFDPLGLIAPVVLRGKNILQTMCRDKLDWDDLLPEYLKTLWERWITDLPNLEAIAVERCFRPAGFANMKNIQLHFFSDACMTGYAQCAYLRLVDVNDKVHCSLVQAKSRVAPLKSLTIPRLELSAAVLSTEVGLLLKTQLDYDTMDCHYWTDSRIVLGFISNESKRFHTFVANRVQSIRNVSRPEQWHHVATDQNPADIASRGCNVSDLINSNWFKGPDFLWNAPVPHDSDGPFELHESCEEIRTSACLITDASVDMSLLDFSRISSWNKAKRIIAYCVRFVENLKSKGRSSMSVSDLVKAEKWLCRKAQEESFSEEISQLTRNADSHLKKSSKLYRLDAFMDEDGLLRVGGRLKSGGLLPYEIKHPIVLPKVHVVTNLLVRDCHESSSHQGKGMTVNTVRGRGFWVVGLPSVVSKLIYNCVMCRRLRSYPQGQKMADLPEDRLEPGPPFTHVGVDCFGPFYIRAGRKELKRYGVLFTCLVSRAIHIETVNTMDTSSFVNALRRMLSLRGPIQTLRSDRGTNFIGGMRALQESMENVNDKQVKEFLLQHSCDYIVNCPSASHHGGVWERLIRSVRCVLNSLLVTEGHILDDEGLRTLLCEAANIVNSRPLSVTGLNDPTSLQPISPNHLLTMKTNVVLPPPGEFQSADGYSRKRWRRVQYLANAFWERWRKEFVSSMQPRSKWTKPRKNLAVGNVVLVVDDSIPRTQWKLGRVVTACPGQDGLVRKVKIHIGNPGSADTKKHTAQSYLERPVQKLVLLLDSQL